jgi:hypothetical protein
MSRNTSNRSIMKVKKVNLKTDYYKPIVMEDRKISSKRSTPKKQEKIKANKDLIKLFPV